MTNHESHTARIGLGTVQFGLDYGIANSGGRVPFDEVERILGRAATLGMKVLDTAALYGVSEETLGKILGPHHPFQIVTKTPKADSGIITSQDATNLVTTFERSLRRLNQQSIYGLLVHDADDLLKPGGQQLLETLRQFKSDKLVTAIGVSVYTGSQLDGVLDLFAPDIVQLPLNVLDQRLVNSGHLDRLHRLGVEIHARSVFLQGLLLMEPQSLDGYFAPMRERLVEYRDYMARCGLTPLEGALRFASGQDQIDTIIVGVCSRTELEDIRVALMRPSFPNIDFARWALDDPQFVNPSLWQLIETAAALQE